MRGLKYLYRRSFGHRVMTLVSACVSAAFIAMAMIIHEEAGSDDYLVCKAFLIYGTLLYGMLCEIFLNVDIMGGRCMRASGIARELYTVSVPLYGIITSAATLIVPISAYCVFIAASGRDISNISDALIIAAGISFLEIIVCPFAMCLRNGFLVAIYGKFPFAFSMFFLQENIRTYGFGLPLWAACLIPAGAFAVSSAIAFISARLLYFKAEFKPAYQSQINGGV